jgi:hypothetical protein
MRFDTSMESLIGIGRSESFADLNNPDFARNLLSSSSSLFSGSGNKELAISLMKNLKTKNFPQQETLEEVVTVSAENRRWRIL